MKKVDVTIQQKAYNFREEIKTLRTNIQFCGDDKQVILMTSCLPGEGKTTTSIQLASSIAEMGSSVVLIDADMRKSVMVSKLQMRDMEKGLSHFLTGQCPLADVLVATNIPKLHLIIAGRMVPNPTELLETMRFQGMIESLRKVYDYIIIDCPPLGLVVDAAIIARECDGAILVVESAKTKYRLAQSVKEKLNRTGIPILGVVLNKIDRKKNSNYYNKMYGKSYRKEKYDVYYGSGEDLSLPDRSRGKSDRQKSNPAKAISPRANTEKMV